MAIPRSVGIVFVGIATGLVAGDWLYLGGPEGENRTDLFVAPTGWPAVVWLLVFSWLIAIWVAWFETFSRGWRSFALGWVIGLPALYLVSLLYAWHTFGTFGYAPVP